jgi:ribonuclease HI
MSDDMHLVIYTDGSANPNPGFIGAAAHGYIYSGEENSTVYELYDSVLTDKGYKVTTKFDKELDRAVKPLFFIEQNSSYNVTGTNNLAEMYALRHALELIYKTEHKLTSAQLYTDSNYSVQGINEWSIKWKENNWIRQDGIEIANKKTWKEILSLIEQIKEKGINVSVDWVKGHNECIGNILADFGANIARANSKKGIYEDRESISDAKNYFVNKVDIHPLICFTDVVISTREEQNIKGLYYLHKSNLPANMTGKANGATSYAIVYLREPEQIIEGLKTRQVEAKLHNSITLANMDKIKNKKYYDRIKNSVFNSLHNKGNSNSLIFYDEELITVDINPPGLLIRAIEHYEHLSYLMSSIEANLYKTTDTKRTDLPTDQYELYDINHFFYEKSLDKKNKEVFTLKPDFVVGFRNIAIDIAVKGKKIKIPMSLGLDMPDRNVLKRIEKMSPNIQLVVWENTAESFGYCVFIGLDNAFSVWSNMSSAKIFI